jgi:acyl-CoA thioester hydrolase
VDAQGFLFNARYLELADVAMTEFFRVLGWSYPELMAGGVDPAVVTANLSFRRPARLDDLLDVDCSCTRVGTSSFDLQLEVGREDESIASIDLVYVNVDAAMGSARPMPTAVADRLRESVGQPAPRS